MQERGTVVEVLGVSLGPTKEVKKGFFNLLGPTVDLGRADHNFKMFQDGDGTVTVDGTGS